MLMFNDNLIRWKKVISPLSGYAFTFFIGIAYLIAPQPFFVLIKTKNGCGPVMVSSDYIEFWTKKVFSERLKNIFR